MKTPSYFWIFVLISNIIFAQTKDYNVVNALDDIPKDLSEIIFAKSKISRTARNYPLL
ncbi:MAG: hypothetical protein Q4G16_12100 [Cruoricaptor ignavus]|nr:hypothetical protein [Cruoricaptor ignavus]